MKKDRRYVYAAGDESLSFGERLGDVGERGHDNAKAVQPKVPYPFGDPQEDGPYWKVLSGEIIVFDQDGGPRVSARIRPCTVYEITPTSISIVMENVQPGSKQFEEIPAPAASA